MCGTIGSPGSKLYDEITLENPQEKLGLQGLPILLRCFPRLCSWSTTLRHVHHSCLISSCSWFLLRASHSGGGSAKRMVAGRVPPSEQSIVDNKRGRVKNWLIAARRDAVSMRVKSAATTSKNLHCPVWQRQIAWPAATC